MKYQLDRSIFLGKQKKLLTKILHRNRSDFERLSAKQLSRYPEIVKAIKEEGVPSYLVRKTLRKDLGDGIFLHPEAKPIEKGELISLYTGELTLMPQNAPDDSSYAFDLIDDLHLNKRDQKALDPKMKFAPGRRFSIKLDAAKTGNFTRFINHSEKPNVEARTVSLPASFVKEEQSPIEIAYVAKKRIMPGEQLLVNYEDGEESYWGTDTDFEPFPMDPKTFRIDANLSLITP
jgi:hypothetical protein